MALLRPIAERTEQAVLLGKDDPTVEPESETQPQEPDAIAPPNPKEQLQHVAELEAQNDRLWKEIARLRREIEDYRRIVSQSLFRY